MGRLCFPFVLTRENEAALFVSAVEAIITKLLYFDSSMISVEYVLLMPLPDVLQDGIACEAQESTYEL